MSVGPTSAAVDGVGVLPGLTSQVMAVLAGVRDPELDESITDLGFVADVGIAGGAVDVALRLPTYFCAPNFAWLMVNDAHAAVAAVAGVQQVQVRLVDHFAAEEINTGVGEGRGFGASFAGLADGELDELRQVFRRKALAARQDRLCRALLAGGSSPTELVRLRLGDLPAGPETETYLQRRAELGMDVSPGASLLVDNEGQPISPEQATAYLRRMRTIAVSIEGNAGFCRGMLATRYDTTRSNA
jgi:metal-sulfur cluster biosynthetic enzyme